MGIVHTQSHAATLRTQAPRRNECSQDAWIPVGKCGEKTDLEAIITALRTVWHNRYDYRIDGTDSFELLIRHC
jgi:hypothetical protein